MRVSRIYPTLCKCGKPAFYNIVEENKAARQVCGKCLTNRERKLVEKAIPVNEYTKIGTIFGCREVNSGDVTQVMERMTKFEKSRGENSKVVSEIRREKKSKDELLYGELSMQASIYFGLVGIVYEKPPIVVLNGRNFSLICIMGKYVLCDVKNRPIFYSNEHGKKVGYVKGAK